MILIRPIIYAYIYVYIYIYIYTYKECDNIEIMMGSETYDIIAELSEFLLQKYQ